MRSAAFLVVLLAVNEDARSLPVVSLPGAAWWWISTVAGPLIVPASKPELRSAKLLVLMMLYAR